MFLEIIIPRPRTSNFYVSPLPLSTGYTLKITSGKQLYATDIAKTHFQQSPLISPLEIFEHEIHQLESHSVEK